MIRQTLGLHGRPVNESAFTLVELLVVLVILVIVLGGLATMFVSAIHSETDQTNRVQAQQDGRLILDRLRREIHCASGVSSVSLTTLTITLPSYCATAPSGGGSVTWCATGTSAPYALKRYPGSACSGAGGIQWIHSLSSNAVFTYNRSGTLMTAATGLVSGIASAKLTPATYAYDITAVVGTSEISGTVSPVVVSTGSTNQITLTWASYAGATAYNVYGRDDGSGSVQGLRLLATCPGGTGCVSSTSFVDQGTIDTTNIQTAPPLGSVSVSLTTDKTTASTSQDFSFGDDIVLRNSGRY
jgi:prepilin-type N-terminal cleavage/methylation domain-containing protein